MIKIYKFKNLHSKGQEFYNIQFSDKILSLKILIISIVMGFAINNNNRKKTVVKYWMTDFLKYLMIEWFNNYY